MTPNIPLAELDVLPNVSVREWLIHTSHMLIYDWFPLTYFCIAALIAPRDDIGCHSFVLKTLTELLWYVYIPVLMLRFIGISCFLKHEYILGQILVIYGYLFMSLSIWEGYTLTGMRNLDGQCFKPMKMSTLNIILMSFFYLFVLTPLYTFVFVMPLYLYKVYREVQYERRKRLMKHYVVKAMPSVLFSKKLFKEQLNKMASCGICMDVFIESDYVTPLYCHGQHAFHSNCIESWFKQSNQCPLCRAP
jgi:hypothetical protein